MHFDKIIDRRGSHCVKWDMMDALYGVPAETGLAMWVADMDFLPPQVVLDAVQAQVDHGVIGYFGDDSAYRGAIQWWMETRHSWQIEPDHIFTTHGLVNGTALCVDTFTAPGDGVVLFTPVYHAFAKVIKANNRRVVECPLVETDGRYTMDFDAYDAQLDGSERMVILCSPHNPGGRVWTRAEIEGVAAFARRHDLIMPGHTHVPMAHIDGIADRLVMMTATTKTFNIAGAHTGNVIIADPALRAKFAARMMGLGLSPNSFGLFMSTAAYSPDGAEWLSNLIDYLDGNRRVFDDAINAIPGLRSMPLEATYLSWVSFEDTGMPREEFTRRVQEDAQIAVNHGPTFGLGGEPWLRFNIATPRARIEEAVARVADAFSDLQ